MKKMLTKAELADMYGISVRTVDRWRDAGMPVAVYRPVRFDPEAVAKWHSDRVSGRKE